MYARFGGRNVAKMHLFIVLSEIFLALRTHKSELKILPKCSYSCCFVCDFLGITGAQFGVRDVAKPRVFRPFHLRLFVGVSAIWGSECHQKAAISAVSPMIFLGVRTIRGSKCQQKAIISAVLSVVSSASRTRDSEVRMLPN